MKKNENRNLLLAILLCLAVIFSMDYWLPSKKSAVLPQTNVADTNEVPPIAAKVPDTAVVLDNQTHHQTDAHIQIKTDSLSGSIYLKGALLDNLTFLKYKETTKKDSPDVTFLDNRYFVRFGVQSTNGEIILPNAQTLWSSDSDILGVDKPVTLTWINPQQIVFSRKISLDKDYMFTVTDSVFNPTDKDFAVSFDAALVRTNPPSTGVSSVHQGLVGVMNNKLQEEKYDTVLKDKKISFDTKAGWLGITDKYWLSALIFNQNTPNVKASFTAQTHGDDAVFVASYAMPFQPVKLMQTVQSTMHLFTGPKELDIITGYQEKLGIDKFELSIDFGWFYFLTKPFLYLLGWLNMWVGNMGIAILIFATLLRILLLPIAAKSFTSMAKMRKVQPKLKALQNMYKNDKMRFNQETMALYKKEKINPAAGCLPMFIQIPVFFSLYKVLSVSLEMRQAPFFGWITDLSVADPSSVFTVFGLVPWPIPSFLNLGVWPILMGLTMWWQQKLSPSPTGTGAQPEALKWMPVIFTFMMGSFASGLVIYWTWSNLLSIAQQRYIMRKYGQ